MNLLPPINLKVTDPSMYPSTNLSAFLPTQQSSVYLLIQIEWQKCIGPIPTCNDSGPLVCLGVAEDGAGGEALVEVRDGLRGVRTVAALSQGRGQPPIQVARRQITNVGRRR